MALIDVPTLAHLLADVAPPTVIDVRWQLGGPPGRNGYLAGHIPGAAFLDLETDVSGRPEGGARHPLPDPQTLQSALRGAGVRANRPVVVYDGGDGHAAARLWWTLRWAGHPDVAVLDGGFAAWLAADRPVEPGQAEAPAGDIVVRPGQLPVVDADGAAELTRAGVLYDARVAPRFRGETEPIDPVAGHIPGATNLPAAQLSTDGRFKPAAELASLFPSTGPVGAYCGSGVTAASTVLALHLAGRTDAALYVGSWSDWVSDPDRPVATGEQA